MWGKFSISSYFIFIISFSGITQVENARRIVEVLCSDSLYGRGYVNNGVNKAADFLINEFQNVGLEPFFGDTSYVQDYSFSVNTFPKTIEIKSGNQVFVPGVDYLVGASSGSFKGELSFLELDSIAFYGNRAIPESVFDELEHAKANSFLIDLTQFSAEKYKEINQYCQFLSNVGTVVLLTNQKIIWTVAQLQNPYPIIYFQKASFPSSELEVDIEAELIEDFPNKNLIGYIPSDKKRKNQKKIVFTAHYDHLGIMGTQPSLTYFPGGNDNASGVSMLISMAKYFKENPSKYDIVFIAFSGEEIGLLGSEYFVDSKSMDLSEIKFLINLDIMGSGEDGITVVNGSLFTKEFDKLVKINKKKNYLNQIKKRGEAPNSDHWFFYKAGVPSIFIYTMGPNKNYHDIYDTYQELSFDAFDNIVKLLVDFVGKL